MATTVEVASLYIHPVKSAAPIPLTAAALTRDGFVFDRQWAIVRADTGRFISQRDTPSLALITPALPADALLGGWGDPPPDAALTLSAPGAESMAVLLAPEKRTTTRVSVWEFAGDAYDEGDDVAVWLSSFLGKSVRLVRYAPHVAPRTVAPSWAARASPGAEAAFCDGFPLLFISAESVAAASAAACTSLDERRWRPNIVTRGAGAPWAEDGWARVRVGDIDVSLVKPCDRCTIPHVNPDTGERDVDATAVLRPTRTGAVLGWEALPAWKRALFFGWNGVPVVAGGGERGRVLATVRVGDGVTVVEARAGAPGGGGGGGG